MACWLVLRSGGAHQHPARCPDGLHATGARCCGAGQLAVNGECDGPAQTCSSAQTRTAERCGTRPERVVLAAGVLLISVDDWDLQERAQARGPEAVQSFALDRFEVTAGQWQTCVLAGVCDAVTWTDAHLPVRNVSAQQAQAYCQRLGGQLPTSAQWLWAARGASGRRYPWGAFGLVCRRAVFGLTHGPCAHGAVGPDWPGSRPDGATPEGVFDLAGNVAEWTWDPASGETVARGGSYRSRLAAELKTLAFAQNGEAAPDVGFRCAYGL